MVSQEEANGFPSILKSLSALEAYSSYFPTPLEDISKNKRFVDDNGVDDHHALIPTETPPASLSSLSKDEQRIYDMVVKSFIAAHYPNARYDQSEILTLVDEQFLFKTKGSRLVSEGWKSIYSNEPKQEDEESSEEEQSTLPAVKENEVVTIQDMELKEGITKAPQRFTSGQLVKVMANAGAFLTKEEKEGFSNKELSLGTVATQASIIKQVLDKGYASVQKNKVYLNPKGALLMEILGEKNWLASPVTTGKMESYLAEIGKGKKLFEPFLKRTNVLITEFVHDLIEQSKSWNFGDMTEVVNQDAGIGFCKFCGGAVVDKGKFYGCENYLKTKCSFSISKKIAGKDISQENVKCLLEKGTTPLINGFLKKNKEDTFDAFLVWDSNQKKVTFSFEGVPPKKKK